MGDAKKAKIVIDVAPIWTCPECNNQSVAVIQTINEDPLPTEVPEDRTAREDMLLRQFLKLDEWESIPESTEHLRASASQFLDAMDAPMQVIGSIFECVHCGSVFEQDENECTEEDDEDEYTRRMIDEIFGGGLLDGDSEGPSDDYGGLGFLPRNPDLDL